MQSDFLIELFCNAKYQIYSQISAHAFGTDASPDRQYPEYASPRQNRIHCLLNRRLPQAD